MIVYDIKKAKQAEGVYMRNNGYVFHGEGAPTLPTYKLSAFTWRQK